ncbi:hypothetical protein F5Y16DRAFT_29265 [Xylariaceae sp. FL0255]|nr:hypothetical protein F5Y16DRAFT_29265 [Xylariaceae sp. FL0255]
MDDNTVYLGVWTNYSKGRILGATLTTTPRNGALLIAFTGFLIPFVASRFWKLLCLALHGKYSTSEPRNAFHHQRQVILRNSSSPDSGLWSMLQMVWAWRRFKHTQDIRSIFLIIIYAAASIAVFSAAGGLSSQISVSAGSEVLLLGTNCGIPFIANATDPAPLSYSNEKENDAANYVQQCYSAHGSGSLDCDTFVTKTLPTALTEYNANCPFQNNMCRGNRTSIHLDTGYIDSDSHLGLNLPAHQGFAYRQVLTCSPLVTDGYHETYSVGNASFVRYKYGGYVESSGNILNYTYEYENISTQYRYFNSYAGKVPSLNYVLGAAESTTYQGRPYPGTGLFIPVSSLLRQDGDVSVSFLSGNGVRFYGHPMNDEWYRATVPSVKVTGTLSLNQSVATYTLSEAASPLGCAQQFQWCNTAYPNDSGCGPLASAEDALYGAAQFFNLSETDLEPSRPSSDQAAGTRLIWPGLMTLDSVWNEISSLVTVFGTQTLASQDLLDGGIQLPLPLNQWQMDVTKWWNLSLASLQSSFLETALGEAPNKSPPLNDQERKLCSSQKILSNNFSNFNLFGLLVTYVTSALIVLVSFIAEPILEWLSRKKGYRRLQQLEWMTNASLQLHRLAQEELGEIWLDGAGTVPTTTSLERMLAPLDISNPDHPVLARPQPDTLSEQEIKPDQLDTPSEAEVKPDQPDTENNRISGTDTQVSMDPAPVSPVDSFHDDLDEETATRPVPEAH